MPRECLNINGLVSKYYFTDNVWGLIRYEKAIVNQPVENGGTKTGAMDAVWGLWSLAI